MEQVGYPQSPAASANWHALQPATSQERQIASLCKVLLVGLCEESREQTETALPNRSYDLIEAVNTSEAITALSLYRVDLIIIDAAVSGLGAIEFCRLIKSAGATELLPVFVIAGSDDLEREVRSIEAGADQFFVRPIRPLAFEARLQASLRKKVAIESLDDSETVLFSLAQSVEYRDPSLKKHCERLATMGTAMGLALGLPPHEISVLHRGGYLHDIGKVGIPDGILFKAGPLTSEEWDIMKSHAERGERICSSMRSLAPVLPIIRSHHERWDGSGYPDGLRGEQIPLLARILQLADIYDALTTERPYKPALRPDDALRVIREEVEKGWRDPGLVDLLADLMPQIEAAPPEISRLSLGALASSVERFRNDAQRSPSSLAFAGNLIHH